jgi:hypothetical protein
MAKTNGGGPTQESQPKEGEPVEIRIPTREEVFRDLGKVAKLRKKNEPPFDLVAQPGSDAASKGDSDRSSEDTEDAANPSAKKCADVLVFVLLVGHCNPPTYPRARPGRSPAYDAIPGWTRPVS